MTTILRLYTLAAFLAAGCVAWHREGKGEDSGAFQGDVEACADRISHELGCRTFEKCADVPGSANGSERSQGSDALRAMNRCLASRGWSLDP